MRALKNSLILGHSDLGYDLVKLEDLVQIMESLGLTEKKPVSKKHLSFEKLDLKSRRIMNRLGGYL